MLASISSAPSVARPVALKATNPPSTAPSTPTDTVDAPRFAASASSLKRDALIAGLMGVSMCLPPTSRMIVGGVAGLLGVLTGVGELHEGMKRGDTHEALDGAIHVLTGGITAGIGMTHTLGGLYLLSGGVGLLGTKCVADHPKDAIVGTAKEAWQYTRDSGAAVVAEFRRFREKKPAPQPQPQPQPAPAPPSKSSI